MPAKQDAALYLVVFGVMAFGVVAFGVMRWSPTSTTMAGKMRFYISGCILVSVNNFSLKICAFAKDYNPKDDWGIIDKFPTVVI